MQQSRWFTWLSFGLAPTLVELEKMLVEAGGTKSLIDEAKAKSHGLGLFIRSLVGLEREAAMQAFSNFLHGTTATPEQIEFVFRPKIVVNRG